MKNAVQYRVRPVTRYIVTKFEYELREDGRTGACSSSDCRQLGPEYANEDIAFEVAYALCRADHERLGYELGDERVKYPTRPSEEDALPCNLGIQVSPNARIAAA